MDIDASVELHSELARAVAAAIVEAGPVGDFEAELDYVESRDPCDSDLTSWQVWTPRLSATGSDPGGDAFWSTTLPAAQAVAESSGFQQQLVLEDHPGAHAVEFSDGSGALILLMARATAEDPGVTRTSVVVRTGCHPEAEQQVPPTRA